MANIKQQEQERLKLLEQIEETEKRINAQNEKAAVSKSKEAKRLQAQMVEEKKQLDKLKEQLGVAEKILKAETKRKETAQKRREHQEEAAKYEEDQLKSISKLSPQVKALLNDQVTKSGVVSDITREIIELKKKELQFSLVKGQKYKYSEEQRAQFKLTREELEKQKDLVVESATSSAFTKMTDEQKEAAKIQAETNGLTAEGIRLYMKAYEQRKQYAAQEEKIKQIQGAQKGFVDALPDGIKSIITTIKEFLTVVAAIGFVWAGLIAIFALGVMAMQELSKAAKKFREDTGILNSQMQDIRDKAAAVTQEMAQLGVEAEDVYNVITALKKEFGDIANISKDTVRALTILNSNFGVANEDATEFISQLEAMTGLSEEAATNYALQVTEVAKLAKVAPKQLFKDIAESAKDTAEYFGNSFDNMARTALEARRLGTTLKDVMGVSEKLLDFESGIEQELKASAFAQGQFNLTQARALAATKDYSGALDEVLNQMERGGRFAEKDLFTQRELAKAVGSTPAVIQKMIAQREKLSHLGEEEKSLAQQAIANGFDITNANKEQLQLAIDKLKTEQEMQGQLSRITNAFKGIGMVIGTAVLPFLEATLLIVEPFAMFLMGVVDAFGKLGSMLNGISKSIFGASEMGRLLFKVVKGIAMAGLVAGAAFMALSGNIIGSITLVIAGSSLLNGISIDDGEIDSKGNVVSTPKGTVRLNSEDTFVGNKNGIVAGTNLFGNVPRPSTLVTQNSGQNLNNLIAANTKAMNDLRTGGIQATAMYDMAKVNPIIQSYQSKSTRNNFNIPLNA